MRNYPPYKNLDLWSRILRSFNVRPSLKAWRRLALASHDADFRAGQKLVTEQPNNQRLLINAEASYYRHVLAHGGPDGAAPDREVCIQAWCAQYLRSEDYLAFAEATIASGDEHAIAQMSLAFKAHSRRTNPAIKALLQGAGSAEQRAEWEAEPPLIQGPHDDGIDEVLARFTTDDLHAFALGFVDDGDLAMMRRIIRLPACDAGTALQPFANECCCADFYEDKLRDGQTIEEIACEETEYFDAVMARFADEGFASAKFKSALHEDVERGEVAPGDWTRWTLPASLFRDCPDVEPKPRITYGPQGVRWKFEAWMGQRQP